MSMLIHRHGGMNDFTSGESYMILQTYWVVFVAIAAISHAVWNFLLKQSEDKTIFLWSLRIWAVIWFLPVSILLWPTQGIPLKELFFWGLGSIAFHGLYAKVLAKAYEYTDFSVLYPVARGLGPLFTVFIGITLLGEKASGSTLAGALLIFSGMMILYSGWNAKSGIQMLRSLTKNPFPFLVGLSIAGYTVFDKLAISFIPAIILNVIENTGQVFILSMDIRQKDKGALRKIWRESWYKMAIAGFLSALAYILVLLVMTKMPVSKVAPIRESSIIVGALLGLLFLNEKFSKEKIVGSIVIFLGVVTIVLK